MGRFELTDAVHRERGLVRHHTSPPRPQRPAGQVVVQVRHPFGEPEKPAVDAQPVPRADVVGLSLVGVPDLLRWLALKYPPCSAARWKSRRRRSRRPAGTHPSYTETGLHERRSPVKLKF